MPGARVTPRGRWSVRLARVASIDIRAHATLLLLLAWIAIDPLVRGRGAGAALAALLIIVCVFTIIVVHELAHALVARRFGVQTRDITLLPIGGVSSLERIPERPRQELAIALAGPAVNVALALLLAGLLALAGAPFLPGEERSLALSIVAELMWINVGLAVFNLLPAFPMDGGRVLRATLALRMDYDRATRAAARLGQLVAVGFGVLGFFFNPILVLIALFVWIGAKQEAAQVHVRAALDGVAVERAMITRFVTLSPRDTLARALELALGGFQQSFPVVDGGRVVGVLGRERMSGALRSAGAEALVGDVMERDFEVVGSHDPVERVLPKLSSASALPVVVTDDGAIVGLVTPDSLAQLLLAGGAPHGRPG
jgi:Zn-dependent protease/CBS domain-containing protein